MSLFYEQNRPLKGLLAESAESLWLLTRGRSKTEEGAIYTRVGFGCEYSPHSPHSPQIWLDSFVSARLVVSGDPVNSPQPVVVLRGMEFDDD